MKLWIDDVRTSPDGWVWCKSSKEAVDLLIKHNIEPNEDRITHISFDHDLGIDIDGSLDEAIVVAKFIEEAVYNKLMLSKIHWDVHSANPVGKTNIEMTMESAERFWKS